LANTHTSRLQSAPLPAAGTLLSILSCYGVLGTITALSLIGVTLAINVHVWAAAIVAFALVAVLGLAVGVTCHQSKGPLALGAVATLVVIWAIYGSQGIRTTLGIPSEAVELVGFAGLVAATIWDWRLKKRRAGEAP
jgi:hypothetical protein